VEDETKFSLVLLGLVAVGGYFYFRSRQSSPQILNVTPVSLSPQASPAIQPSVSVNAPVASGSEVKQAASANVPPPTVYDIKPSQVYQPGQGGGASGGRTDVFRVQED